jgi:FixJ family two-component response regulator
MWALGTALLAVWNRRARLEAERCRIPAILIMARGHEEMRFQALREGSMEFLVRPFDDDVLIESVQAAPDC